MNARFRNTIYKNIFKSTTLIDFPVNFCDLNTSRTIFQNQKNNESLLSSSKDNYYFNTSTTTNK